jgi:hypothetical protein
MISAEPEEDHEQEKTVYEQILSAIPLIVKFAIRCTKGKRPFAVAEKVEKPKKEQPEEYVGG